MTNQRALLAHDLSNSVIGLRQENIPAWYHRRGVWLLALLTCLLVARASHAQEIDVRTHGVTANPAIPVGAPIQALMEKYATATLFFPAGDYLLANTTQDGLVIDAHFHGSVAFAPGARFVCNPPTAIGASCLHLVSATGVTLSNVTVTYNHQSGFPGSRADANGYALLIDASRNLRLSGITIESSPGACFWASNSADLLIKGLRVSHCTADGVHFENDGQVDLQDMASAHTLDDGLAFTSVAPTHPNCGGTADRIRIEDAAARGIAIPGGCDLTISHFEIDRTGVSGVLVSTDEAFHMRRPARIAFNDGVIDHAGVLPSSSGSGNKFGIEVSAADHVSFDHVRILAPASRGFDVSHGSTFVSLTHSTIRDAGDNAINLLNSSAITLTHDVVDRAAGYGAYLADVAEFTGADSTYRNVSLQNSPGNLHRAFWVDKPAGATHQDGLRIIDDQAVAQGFIVGCSEVAGQPFSVTGVSASIQHGKLQVECAGEVRSSEF